MWRDCKIPVNSMTPARYNAAMLPDLRLEDVVRLRKPHPCGSYEWLITRIGADIGLECMGCQRRVMLTRREFRRRLKMILPKESPEKLNPLN